MNFQNKNNFHAKHKRLLKSEKVDSQKVDSQKVDSQKKKNFSIKKIKECNPNYNQFSVLSNE